MKHPMEKDLRRLVSKELYLDLNDAIYPVRVEAMRIDLPYIPLGPLPPQQPLRH